MGALGMCCDLGRFQPALGHRSLLRPGTTYLVQVSLPAGSDTSARYKPEVQAQVSPNASRSLCSWSSVRFVEINTGCIPANSSLSLFITALSDSKISAEVPGVT